MNFDVIVLLLNCLCCLFVIIQSSHLRRGEPSSRTNSTFSIFMPGAQPSESDAYLCIAYPVELGESYITHFEPNGNADKAHHMLLYGCEDVNQGNLQKIWSCNHAMVCVGSKVMYAWAKNAPPTTLPKDVGFHIGKTANVNYMVLQVHYIHPLTEKDHSGFSLTLTHQRQKYVAGIYLLMSVMIFIPPDTPVTHSDVNCKARTTSDIHPFAYRVHAHTLGVVITGYKYNDQTKEFTLLGKGNPQWPQAFYPMDEVHTVTKDDYLTVRCTFNSTGRLRTTYVGATAADEMCNLYIMYYTDAPSDVYHECDSEESTYLTIHLPQDSDVPLPPNPKLEEHAKHKTTIGHKEEVSLNYNNLFNDTMSVVDKKTHSRKKPPVLLDYNTYSDKFNSNWNGNLPQDFLNNNPLDSTVLNPYNPTKNMRQFPVAKTNFFESYQQGMMGPGHEEKLEDSDYHSILNWPSPSANFGVVSAVSLDPEGNVVIFHRGDRVWNYETFDLKDVYQLKHLGSIPINPVVVLNVTSGDIIKSWGKDIFYLPHGLTIDKDHNLWVTDVALHQVFKYPPIGTSSKALITLGIAFEPGSDNVHFCKPSAVAVMTSGDFFVSDGYCNSRIIKYNALGQRLLQFGQKTENQQNLHPPPYALYVPHALTLAEDKGLVCVADRENGRIQCFTTTNGTFHCEIESKVMGGRLFSMAYSHIDGGRLYAVNGPNYIAKVQGFVIDLDHKKVLSTFTPSNEDLQNPHDIAVNADATELYVVELDPHKVWKFVKNIPKKILTIKDGIVLNSSNKPQTSLPTVSILAVGKNTEAVITSGGPILESFDNLKHKTVTFTDTLIVACVVSIPFLLIILIVVIIRIQQNTGQMKKCCTSCCGDYKTPHADKFGLGDYLKQRKGFEKLNTEESDQDGDIDSGSDVEEFKVTVGSTRA